jgi:hypothetical protein
MLKIWLTWLQPSLGMLGTALVLSYSFCAHAATKPVAVRNTIKVPTQLSQWSSAKSSSVQSNGTTLDREVLRGIPVTPDSAVRQLAINSMVQPGMQPNRVTAKTLQGRSKALPKFSLPSAGFLNFSSKVTKTTKTAKPQHGKRSVATVLSRAINSPAMVPVPGLFIGNSNVPVAKRVLPTGKLTAQTISSAPGIGEPTPLSAMMTARTTAADPFPVVRPEMMQKLEQTQIAASSSTTKTTPHSLDPIATIPSGRPQAVIPKAVGLKSAVPHSLDPIANIPSGLQQFLGNNINGQPTIASTSVAKVVKVQPNAGQALNQLVTPTVVVPASVSAASLRLATAQAYTSVPKFNIPGETVSTARAVNPFVVKREQQKFTTAVVSRKSNYVAVLTPVTKQSWTVVNQRNNLGGLILGSQPISTGARVVGLSAPSTPRTSTSVGLPTRNAVDFN